MTDNRHLWKSLKQYNNNESSIENTRHEFKSGVTDDFDVSSMPDKSRRKFLAAVGATTALMTTACSDYFDKGEIITYNKKPDSVTYGNANYYASTLNDGKGVLIKTREGRPIKVDGNPEHPIEQGKVDANSQAAILDLYDPGRQRYPIKKSDSKLILFSKEFPRSEWEKLDKEIVEKLKIATQNNKEIALITGKMISPTQKKLFNDFIAKYPTSKVYSLDTMNEQARRLAHKDSYGTPETPSINYDKADIIVALESDFLGNEGNTSENTRMFTSRRDINNPENFNRLYAIEGDYSLTGANADYRMRLNPINQIEFIMSLLSTMNSNHGFSLPAGVSNFFDINLFNFGNFVTKYKWAKEAADQLIRDIVEKRSKVLFVAGNSLPYQVHLAVNMMNAVLGNSEMFNYTNTEILQQEYATTEELKELVGKMYAGNIEVLINLDTNPVFTLPSDLKLKDAIKKVPTVISLVESKNESILNSSYVIGINNQLESWGDFEVRKGIVSLQQPIIAPIHDTRQKEAVMLNWLQDDVTKYSHDIYHKYLMNNIETQVYPKVGAGKQFNEFWVASLHDGVIKNESTATTLGQFNPNVFSSVKLNYSSNGITVILKPGFYIKDGKQANNGWLQEIPHPITKVCWDNYASISPNTAKKYELKFADDNKDQLTDMIEIDINGRKIKIPILIQPGLADDLVVLEYGYGRTEAGEIGNEVGVDVNKLKTINPEYSEFIYTGCKITKIADKYSLMSTQEHHSLDDEFVKDIHRKRYIIQDYNMIFYLNFKEKFEQTKKELHEKYHNDPKKYEEELEKEKLHLLGHHKYDNHSIYPEMPYTGVKWGMGIDMNKCTGCGICVASCNVENNIPVVGKEQVGKGREMHWMRIDTYFSGTPDEPITSLQPMLCQHCDHAPCENVCPVVATSHSPDGLNQMTYNRCVGTRYCSNNCPYKVRRFNFFNFRNDLADGYYRKDTLELLNNPEVTVRERGVMEKCTFCVQRIMEARQNAIKDNKPMSGRDVKTACQEACPASAITFGDVNDKQSDISIIKSNPLAYHVLESLNIKPNVTYIAKVKNIVKEEVGVEHH